MRLILHTTSLLFFLFVFSINAQANSFRWLSSHCPTGVYSCEESARDISADGAVVVGVCGYNDGQNELCWSSGGKCAGFGDYHPENKVYFGATAVSDDGSKIVGVHGYAYYDGGIEYKAYRWTQNTGYKYLGDSCYSSGANDISADGSTIVGDCNGSAALWTQNGNMIVIGDGLATAVSADGSVVVGYDEQAFRWTQESGMVGLGAGYAYGVSADGSVVVGKSGGQAFRWTQEGGMVGLGFLPGESESSASAVSGDGSIIIGSSGLKPFIWDSKNGMRNLRKLLIESCELNLENDQYMTVRGISTDGKKIVGEVFGLSELIGQAWIASIDTPDQPCQFTPGPDACSDPNCPCEEGQGDCDSDAECAPGLYCAQNVGSKYGWPASRDVCEAVCPEFVAGPDACTSSCPCGEGEGDCDSDADCEAGLTCVQNVGANYGWPESRDVCEVACPEFVAGPDACTGSCPCGEGEGDCDSDADCETGLTCVQNVGAEYGWPASRDVCEADCPEFVAGPDACTSSCPCGEGEGDCDSDADCETGLTCVQNVGAEYGWPASRDVCEADCPEFVAGPDACTSSCPCGEGEGDCDSDADCETGLTCVQNVGANYGWPESRDVCEAVCPEFVPGPDACTSNCPCGDGEGDCDSDDDCKAGLICVENVGADYGWTESRDVCQYKPLSVFR